MLVCENGRIRRAIFAASVDYALGARLYGDGRLGLGPIGMSFYRLSITITSLALICVGVAIVVRTVLAGGGIAGFLLGPLFAAAGLGRLYLLRRR